MERHICDDAATDPIFKLCFGKLQWDELKDIITSEFEKTSEEQCSLENLEHVLTSTANYFGITIVLIPGSMSFPLLPTIPTMSLVEEPRFFLVQCSVVDSLVPLHKLTKVKLPSFLTLIF